MNNQFIMKNINVLMRTDWKKSGIRFKMVAFRSTKKVSVVLESVKYELKVYEYPQQSNLMEL